jgi:tRNA-dihydrouridine synthase B
MIVPLFYRPERLVSSEFYIGPHQIANRLMLAPMAGLTDVPFRQVAWENGASYVVSEMVSAKADLWTSDKSRNRRMKVKGIDPVAVQIAGSDPDQMAAAAQRHVDDGAQIIDINFGCPVKKVCRKLAGSALLQDPGLVEAIVAAVAAAVPVPVTVKTRTGTTPDKPVAPQIAKRVERAGAQMIVIHGRSRACRFNGRASHRVAMEVRDQVNIPVVANGDICTAQHAHEIMETTEISAVMIGRGAIGAPWLFNEIAGLPAPDMNEKWAIMVRHLRLIHDFYGEASGVRIARKHLAAYLTGFGFDRMTIRTVAMTANADLQKQVLDRLRASLGVGNKAA